MLYHALEHLPTRIEEGNILLRTSYEAKRRSKQDDLPALELVRHNSRRIRDTGDVGRKVPLRCSKATPAHPALGITGGLRRSA